MRGANATRRAERRAHPHNEHVKAARGVWAWLVGVLVATALIVAPVATPPAHASESGTIHSLLNQGRAGAGLGPLARNAALDQVALNWANQMAANGAMSHNPNVGSQIPGGWSRWGENVARGYPSGAAMYDGWWNSPGHKANMLGDYTDVGIAFVQANGSTWGVQVFVTYGASVPALAPAPPPPAPAPAPAPAPPSAAAPAPAAPPPAAPALTAAPAPAEQPAPEEGAAEPADEPSDGGTWVPGGDDASGAISFADNSAVPARSPADAAPFAADAAVSIQLAADGRPLAADAVSPPLTTVAVSVSAALIALVGATVLAIPRRGASVAPVKRRFRLRNGNGSA